MNPEYANIFNTIKNTKLILELKEKYLCPDPEYPPRIDEIVIDEDKVITEELTDEEVHDNIIYLLENYLISTDVYDVKLLLKFEEGYEKYYVSFNFIFEIKNKNDNNKYYCLLESNIGSNDDSTKSALHQILINRSKYFMTRNLDEIIDLYKFKKTTTCQTYRKHNESVQIDITLLNQNDT
jgi:hypothetical protein